MELGSATGEEKTEPGAARRRAAERSLVAMLGCRLEVGLAWIETSVVDGLKMS